MHKLYYVKIIKSMYTNFFHIMLFKESKRKNKLTKNNLQKENIIPSDYFNKS